MVLLDSNSLHPLKFCHKLVLDSYHHVAVFASNQHCENSGWWLLLYFTIIGAFVILYWAVRNGERSENDFGPDVEAGKELAELP